MASDSVGAGRTGLLGKRGCETVLERTFRPYPTWYPFGQSVMGTAFPAYAGLMTDPETYFTRVALSCLIHRADRMGRPLAGQPSIGS